MFGANRRIRPLSAAVSRVIRAGLACAFAAALPATAQAAPGNSFNVQGTASAEILGPGTLVNIEGMHFGNIANATAPGTVVLNPATSVCTKTGPIILSGTCQAAVFDGMGNRRAVVRLNVSTSITLTGSNGGTMVLDNFTLDTAPDLILRGGNGNGLGNGNRRYDIGPSSGIFTFRVGGTLRVNTNQTPGAYTGTFTVQANFN